MAWKDLSVLNYDGYHTATAKGGSGVKITMQYDDSTDLVTTLKIRFVGSANGASFYSNNGYYLYWNPKSDGTGTLKKIKAPGEKWPQTSSTITLTKDYNATGFSIPEFWFCCTGHPQTPVKEDGKWYITFGDKGKQTFWYYFNTTTWFTGSRQNFKTVSQARTETSVAKRATDVGMGTVSITDNGNNTFTLKGTKGSNGTANPATGPTLRWGYTSEYSNSFSNNSTQDLTIATKTNATRTVYAKCITGATYGSSKTKTVTANIKQYVAPGNVGTPTFTCTKDRLTTQENWTLSWGAATATNSSSPVKGYRIRIYKNGQTIPIKNGRGTVLTTDYGYAHVNRYYYDRELDNTSMPFYPNKNGIVPGDSLYITIYAYAKDAQGNFKFSNEARSATYVVQNSGIMRVKAGGSWREGRVHVKVEGTWKEAKAVYTKVNGVWKESK